MVPGARAEISEGLNDITEPDQYPVPHIQDFSAQLAGTRIFSKIDLIRG